METIINAWGGEGFLSSAALTVIGMLGMLGGLPTEKIHVRVLDLAGGSGDDIRRKTLAEAYKKYYSTVFQSEMTIVFDDISMKDIINRDGTVSIKQKMRNNEALLLGCSAKDAQLDIQSGIYGKPWLGEIYYSDSDFSRLYEDIPKDSEVIIINCGGYRGGGTAATFIPLENMYFPDSLLTHRYTVVTGPVTEFSANVKMPYPEIYFPDNADMNMTDIFRIPEVLERISGLAVTSDKLQKHNANISFLEKEYEKIYSSDHDYRNLDPRFYPSRFLDRIFSDSSKVSAVFINIKTDGKRLLPFDVTSGKFEPDLQFHSLHISSLLNALSIREIIRAHERYSGGKVFSFGTTAGNSYCPDTLFDSSCRERFWQFITMSVLMTLFVHDSMLLPFMPEYMPITEKWGKRKGGSFTAAAKKIYGIIGKNSDAPIDTSEKTEEGRANAIFAALLLRKTEEFIEQYIMSVLRALYEIDCSSSQSEIFGNNTKMLVGDLLKVIGQRSVRFSRENIPDEFIPRIITDVMTEISWLSDKDRLYLNTNATGIFRNYVMNFPVFSSEMNETGAEDYISEIIGYTMSKSLEFIRR